jgi:hypothetical protein
MRRVLRAFDSDPEAFAVQRAVLPPIRKFYITLPGRL